jgi:hypothetical protein
MNLHKATTLLLLGLAYTILHKALFAVFPSLTWVRYASGITSILWVLATSCLILFAYFFLKEVSPLSPHIRSSLLVVIACTGIIVLERLLFTFLVNPAKSIRPLSGALGFLNSVALLIFLVSLDRLLMSESPIRVPARVTIGGLGVTVLLGFLSTGYYVNFLITGAVAEPWPWLQPLAALTFLFTYGVAIWFLVAFGRIKDFSRLLKSPGVSENQSLASS